MTYETEKETLSVVQGKSEYTLEAIVYRQIYKEIFCVENYTVYFLGEKKKMKKEEGAREKQEKWEEAKEEERERNKI